MAVSLSRPDPTSPSSVADAGFTTVRRGFHPDEVRAFLQAVATELRRIDDDNRSLRRHLAEATDRLRRPMELDDSTVAKALGQEATRVLESARQSASAIKIRAEEGAAELLREASAQANEQRQSADVAAAERRAEADSEAEAIVGLAKSEGRAMVSEARKYRERVLADLERRTTMARQQLEELENARQRLLQVFERSRLVAIDVSNELETLKPPSDVVDLTPVTGPVPIVVPASSRPLPKAGGTTPAADDTTDAADALVTSGSTVQGASVGQAAGSSAAVAKDEGAPAADTASPNTPAPDVKGKVETAVTNKTATNKTAASGRASEDAESDDASPDDARADHGRPDDAVSGDSITESDSTTDSDPTTTDDEPAAGQAADTTENSDDVDGATGKPDTASSKGEATNVVDLFRTDSRAASDNAHDDADADAEEDAEEDDAEEDEAQHAESVDVTNDDEAEDADHDVDPDVDGLFARLRSGIVDPESVEAAEAEAVAEEEVVAEDAVEVVAEVEATATDSAAVAADVADVSGDVDCDINTAFARRDEAVAAIAPSVGRHLKRLLVDEQNVALHRLDQNEPVNELADLEVDLDGQAEEFTAAVRNDLLDAAVLGAAEHGGVDSPTLRKALAQSGVLDVANRILTEEVSDELRQRVERSVADNAGDNGALAKRFRSLYREIKNNAVDAAVTEMVRSAFGAGMAASVPPKTPQAWVLDPNGTACPDCEDNSLAPPVPAGEEFPTGHVGAPAHIGCTCMVLPATP